MRRYAVRTPAGAVTVTAARAVVEHGGAMALYGTLPGEDREALVAAFGPGGWLDCMAETLSPVFSNHPVVSGGNSQATSAATPPATHSGRAT